MGARSVCSRDACMCACDGAGRSSNEVHVSGSELHREQAWVRKSVASLGSSLVAARRGRSLGASPRSRGGAGGRKGRSRRQRRQGGGKASHKQQQRVVSFHNDPLAALLQVCY